LQSFHVTAERYGRYAIAERWLRVVMHYARIEGTGLKIHDSRCVMNDDRDWSSASESQFGKSPPLGSGQWMMINQAMPSIRCVMCYCSYG